MDGFQYMIQCMVCQSKVQVYNFQVMFKTRAAASFLNSFKNVPGKACVKRVHNNDAYVNVGN